MDNFSINVASDLHIDQWDSKHNIKYKCGEVKEFPIDWGKIVDKNNKNKILIVAGDVSDNLELSCNYLNDISKYYDKILFVDGNHEHVNKYPNIYSIENIEQKIKEICNDKIIYLPKNTHVINNVAFIGYCGWWDYNSENNTTYFNSWLPHLSQEENRLFCNNVINNAKIQSALLENKIKELQEDNNIKEIVIVTHCVPLIDFCDSHCIDTELNENFTKILDKKYSKLKYWVFGHTHQHFSKKVNGVYFKSNGRGRPEDFNRENYILSNL